MFDLLPSPPVRAQQPTPPVQAQQPPRKQRKRKIFYDKDVVLTNRYDSDLIHANLFKLVPVIDR